MNKQFEFTNDPAKLPLHNMQVHILLNEVPYLGYYDYHRKAFLLGGGNILSQEDAEWLVEVEPKQKLTDDELQLLAGAYVKYNPNTGSDAISFIVGYKAGFIAATDPQPSVVKMTNIPNTAKSQSCMWCGKALSHEGLMRYLEDKPGECDTCFDQRTDSELGRAEQNMI